MNILVSNDDGIHADGIKILTRALKNAGHNIYVVAPDRERSGTGHGVTLHRPLRVSEIYNDDELFGYSVDGTPSDCVKLGFWGILRDVKLDMVVSGINRGANLGSDILYSGTVSAAAEGALNGLKAIAVSLVANMKNKDECTPGKSEKNCVQYNYEAAAKYVVEIIESIGEMEFPEESLININVPNLPYDEIKGVKVTTQGNRKYRDSFNERTDPRGGKYYWLGGEILENETDKDADSLAVKNNYVSVTALSLVLTSETFCNKLRNRI